MFVYNFVPSTDVPSFGDNVQSIALLDDAQVASVEALMVGRIIILDGKPATTNPVQRTVDDDGRIVCKDRFGTHFFTPLYEGMAREQLPVYWWHENAPEADNVRYYRGRTAPNGTTIHFDRVERAQLMEFVPKVVGV